MPWVDRFPTEMKDILSKVFKNDFFTVPNSNDSFLDLTEKDENATVSISITLPQNQKILVINKIEGSGKFPFLKHQKCADKIVLHQNITDKWDVHIFEFANNGNAKRKIKNSELPQLAYQFEGIYLRLLAIIKYFDNYFIDFNIYFHLVCNKDLTSPYSQKIPQTTSPQNRFPVENLQIDNSLLLNNLKYNVIKTDPSIKIDLLDIKYNNSP